ncbi:RNA polymerase sigma factor [Sedimentibacter sp.]|uniref:RNA polymerase sigma factor n=1 Tax=Sedimentibacter sp. TaxID=1960295 RepID=UPI0037DA54EC
MVREGIHILAIITAIQNEEERSFVEDLYIKHGKTMWKYAMFLTKDTFEADELIQISFEKIIKYIDAVKKINCCKMDSYMVSIVRNSYNTMLLKKYKEKELFEYTNFDEISDYIGITDDDYEDIIENCSSTEIMFRKY